MKTEFNIIDFGAIGDGITDCTKAVQAALDEASTCSGKVIVPPGKYMVGHLDMKGQGVSIEGTSAWSYRSDGASTFVLNDADTDSMINITGAFGCAIRGMSLCGNKLGDAKNHPIHGVKLYWDQYNGGSEEDTPTIDDCRIGNFSGDGVHLEHIWCFSVRHSMLHNNGGNGLFLDGWDGFILDNWFSFNEGWGIKGGNVVASITATGNRVEWNYSGGFNFNFGDSYNITGNFFDRSHGPAIDLGGDKNVSLVTITGNIFRRSGAYKEIPFINKEDSCHLRMVNCSNIVVTGNTMRVGRNDGGGGVLTPHYGIIIRENTECIVKNNTMMTGALAELVVEENNRNSIIGENIGTLADETTSTGSPFVKLVEKERLSRFRELVFCLTKT